MELESASRCPISCDEPPAYLVSEADRERFCYLRDLLLTVSDQMCTAMDVDQLARYVIAERDYITYSKQMRTALDAGDIGGAGKIQRHQNTAFQQVQACSSALGLNIASRLKIDLRKPKKDDGDPFDAFE